MTVREGKVFIISGPSGCGKSTLLHHIFSERSNLYFSISATTREPRPNEVNGIDYFFVSKDEFFEMLKNEQLLEYAEYAGNFYGTPKSPIIEKTEKGYNVILDIEVQGAAQVKNKMPEAISIFISPPSLEELERRLRKRSTETEEKIQKRLLTAHKEMSHIHEYDYVVVNDSIDRAYHELMDIIDSYSNTNSSIERN